MTTQRPQFDQLAKIISSNSKLIRTWPLTGGISSQMTAFEIQHANGQNQKLILRQPNQNPNAAKDEFTLLKTLESFHLPTQTPHHFDESCQICPSPYLVLEYIEGQMHFAPSDTDNYIHQLATQLANIHNIDPTTNNLSFLPQNSKECAELCHKPFSSNGVFSEAQIRNTLKSLSPLQPKNATTLLHGDYWPGNTLWQNDKLVAIIDWEDAALGDPLTDLAKSRSEIAWIFDIDTMHRFTAIYQSLMPINYSNLPYWDLCAALRFIRFSETNLKNLASFFVPYGRPDITASIIRKNYNAYIDQAFKALDAAKEINNQISAVK